MWQLLAGASSWVVPATHYLEQWGDTRGFNPFFGTSAAAPHAAAIGGLVLSAHPTFTPAQVRQALTGSALNIEGPGWDRDSGFGIINAFVAINAFAGTGRVLHPRFKGLG